MYRPVAMGVAFPRRFFLLLTAMSAFFSICFIALTTQRNLSHLEFYNKGLRHHKPNETTTRGMADIDNDTYRTVVLKQGVVFIKTHKTGSSSVASILQQYGYTHNWTFLLPSYGSLISYQQKFKASLIDPKWRNTSGYYMLTNHARYDRHEMASVFPNAYYITILREPAAQFESAFYFFDIKDTIPKTADPLAYFMQNPMKNYIELQAKSHYLKHCTHNHQLFDLGVSPEDMYLDNVISDKIAEVDQNFDLVMIAEYFDQSLLLVGKLLRWKIDDLVYLTKGKRAAQFRGKEMTDTLREKIRAWNAGDHKLYTYFNKTLWRKIEAYGPTFHRDLAELRSKIANASESCLNFNKSSTYIREEVISLKSNTSQWCRDAARTDYKFTDVLRKRMLAQGLPLYTFRESYTSRKTLPTQKIIPKHPTVNSNMPLPDFTRERRIVFIKTHKTGSSSVASILQHFGYTHRLPFLVPSDGSLITYQEKFKASMIDPKWRRTSGYYMLTNHARYDQREMASVFPNASYITILREPVAQFESAFYFFDIKDTIPKTTDPLAYFMQNPTQNHNELQAKSHYLKHCTHNHQLFDLGMRPEDMNLDNVISDKIAEVDKNFDLVMIAEYFDQSLLLLGKLLRWKIDDLVYLTKGKRAAQYRGKEMNDTLREKIRAWNAGDHKLYTYFNKTLWRKIEEYGPTFRRDLAELRSKIAHAVESCLDIKKISTYIREEVISLKKGASKWCQDAARSDFSFTDLIRKRMKAQGYPLYTFKETYPHRKVPPKQKVAPKPPIIKPKPHVFNSKTQIVKSKTPIANSKSPLVKPETPIDNFKRPIANSVH